MIGNILYESFLLEKGNTKYSSLGRCRKSFLKHVLLWNIIYPCLIDQNSTQIIHSIQMLNNYINNDLEKHFTAIGIDEIKCFSENRLASLTLYFLINQINIELSGDRNNKKLHMLIRSCHNLPRCMIDGNMHISESLCIEYSLSNMDIDVRKTVSLLIGQ